MTSVNTSIPMSEFADSVPSVLTAGANPLNMASVFVDTDPSIPLGTVQGFGSYQDVVDWYGPGSNQAALAAVYFAGYTIGTLLPTELFFVQYNTAAVAAYLRGYQGSIASLGLTGLQALSGTITIDVNGTTATTATINLASAGSFSAAATIIQSALTTAGLGCTCTYDTLRQAFLITSTTTGPSSTIQYPTDSSLSPALYLTASTGAATSQGAAAATPAGVMNGVVAVTQNWASFMLTAIPELAVNIAFSAWNSAQGALYAYIGCDSDATPTTEQDDSTCFAQQVDGSVGTIPVWDPTLATGALIASIIASINFQATSGNTNFAARSSNAVVVPQVTTLSVYQNLKANGYNMYCNVASRTAKYLWLQPGQISGAWTWITPYINQIYWNSIFQNDFAELLANTPNIPYTQEGYELIYNALSPDIQNMGDFGAWTAGGELSGSQVAEVNQAAGMNIATTIESQGWYLQIEAPSTEVQEEGGSPEATFWYFTGGGVNQISMASIAVEA